VQSVLPQTTNSLRWNVFQGLYVIAALLAGAATFFAISDATPIDPSGGGVVWILGLNMLLIIALAWILVRRYRTIRGMDEGTNRLARRFVRLFSLSAVLPALVMGVLLAATFTRGIETWFTKQTDRLVEQTAAIASDNLQKLSADIALDANLMRAEYDEASGQGSLSEEFYDEFLTAQIFYRDFFDASIIDSNGSRVAQVAKTDRKSIRVPGIETYGEANTGVVAQTLYPNSNQATALAKLEGVDDRYLYLQRNIDPQILSNFENAEQVVTQLRKAKRRTGRLQMIFAVGFAQITALVLLLAARLGLTAATRVTAPIDKLAIAAHAVRDGDLTVRVSQPDGDDEVAELTRSFNGMTEQLDAQRNALIDAREDAEDRRQFVETLLSEVSAGVIRTDDALNVTLANKSADNLLGDFVKDGVNIADIAPEFEPHLRDTLEREAYVDASIDMVRDGEARHFRLKVSPDTTGGCVLLFDDATRLVNAQRQLAWRDVARRIAHEIRNPLTPIQLSTERLRKRYTDKMPADDKVFGRSLDTILRNVGDIGRMVEEFSSFARMPKPSVAPFNLGGLLDNAAFAQTMASPDISVKAHAETPIREHIGDERLLGQAFGNLIKNAAESVASLPEELEVQGRIDITVSDTDDGATIIIEDNGRGFPEEARERLLEPYVTTREKGTGLGLAIVNRIIMDHGGSISLQNRSDGRRGARVRVFLPPVELTEEQTAILSPEPAVEEIV